MKPEDIPLPEPYYGLARRDGGTDRAGPWFDAEQMRAMFAAGRARGLEEAADIAWDMDYSPDGAIAIAIRALKP